MMRYKILLIMLFLPFIVAVPEGKAMNHEKQVTPYGDYCPRCTQYGTCKSVMSHDDSKKAMIDYYNKKGFAVEIENKKGRFIRAKIMNKNEVVDVIIFDRRSGRIRSIY